MQQRIVAPVIGFSLLAMMLTACGTLTGAAIGAGVDSKDPGRGATVSGMSRH